ncbi:MAG: hypothetical protein GY820_07220 [Gammaproteobacteria bacterium]|nr:hypothetical protein [Gammaproteobacteria bacterium]
MSTLFSKWRHYLSLMLSPDVLGSLILAILFGYWATTTTDDTARAIGTVIVALLTAVAGARISKMVIEDTRAVQIHTRGKSALRGLALIFDNLVTLQNQIVTARSECQDEKAFKDFNYISSSTVIIQKQTVNSMEEWQDILPDALAATDTIKQFKQKISEANDLHKSLEAVEKKLEHSQNDASIKGNMVANLEKERDTLQGKLNAKNIEALQVVPSSLSTIAPYPSLNIGSEIPDYLSLLDKHGKLQFRLPKTDQ